MSSILTSYPVLYLSGHTNSKLQTRFAPYLCNSGFFLFLNCSSFQSMDSCIWQRRMHKKKKKTLGLSHKIVYFTQRSISQALNFTCNTKICLKLTLPLNYGRLNSRSSISKGYFPDTTDFLLFLSRVQVPCVYLMSFKPDSLKYLIPLTVNSSMLQAMKKYMGS